MSSLRSFFIYLVEISSEIFIADSRYIVDSLSDAELKVILKLFPSIKTASPTCHSIRILERFNKFKEFLLDFCQIVNLVSELSTELFFMVND